MNSEGPPQKRSDVPPPPPKGGGRGGPHPPHTNRGARAPPPLRGGKRENFLGGLPPPHSTPLRASRSPNLRVETPPQATKGPLSFGKLRTSPPLSPPEAEGVSSGVFYDEFRVGASVPTRFFSPSLAQIWQT